MTDKMDSFRVASAAVQRSGAFKKGVEAVNIAAFFQARGVNLNAIDSASVDQFEM